jgi:hypothetical protein
MPDGSALSFLEELLVDAPGLDGALAQPYELYRNPP